MDKEKNLKQRAIEAYRKQVQRDAGKARRQFQRAFAAKPDHVSILNDGSALIEVNGLLIRSWFAAEGKRWYRLVTKCIECGTISYRYSINNPDFVDLLGLGEALEVLGEGYKAEMVCDDCMKAYSE